MSSIGAALLLLVCLGEPEADAGTVNLVNRGKPAAVIVLSDSPSTAARAAAVQLQHWIRAVSGAELPIVAPSDRRAASSPRVVVGASRLAASLGVDAAGLGPEGIRLRTVGSDLVLLGVDQKTLPDGEQVELNGTFYAAMTFVEQHLGVRWLWPGELGTVVPHSPNVNVPAIDLSFTPHLKMRKYRNRNVWSGEGRGASHWALQDGQQDPGERMSREANLWLLRHKLQAGGKMPPGTEGSGVAGLAPGGSISLNYGHAFSDWYERYGRQHPDWFALQPNGSRVQPGETSRSQFCVANEGLIAELIRHGREYLDANPGAGSYNVCPNDGGAAKFCCCERCTALDVPDTGTTGRYMWLFNRVAEELADTHPDRYVCSYAYSSYKTAFPGLRMHDNVVLGMVMFGADSWLCDPAREISRAQWQGWSGVVRHRFLRPNISSKGGGLPLLYPHRMAEDLKPIFRDDVLGVDFDSLGHHWATEGLNYYVLVKLIWDADVDVDALVDDYCRSGFGAAAPAVCRYFARLEELTSQVAKAVPLEEQRTLTWPWRLAQVREVYSADTLADLAGMLAEAGRLAQADSAEVQNRVQFLREGLRFAELVMSLDKRGVEPARARQQFCRDHRFSWVVTAAYKGGGLPAVRTSAVEELLPETRPDIHDIPILWKTPRTDHDVAAIGYRLIDGRHVFVFRMADSDMAVEASFNVYLDADNDRSTGREGIGNDYYLSPAKGLASYYGTDRRPAAIPLDVCYWHGRTVIVEVRQERFAGTPLAGKFALFVSTNQRKTPRLELDTTATPVELYSPAAEDNQPPSRQD
jgi:hypothetical protein